MVEISEKVLLFVVVYLIIWSAITSTINEPFEAHWSTVTAEGPDRGDFPFDNETFSFPAGTITYLGAVVADGGAKVVAFFSALIALVVLPELTMYGQTVDASALGWFQTFLFFGAVFGVVGQLKGWL